MVDKYKSKSKGKRRLLRAIASGNHHRVFRVMSDVGAIYDDADILRRLDRYETIQGARI